MKKVVGSIIILALFICPLCLAAGPFNAQDEEAKEVALFVEKMLGDSITKPLAEKYSGATFEWNGRIMGMDRAATTWVVFCEVKQGDKELGYHYWEVRVSHINDNPELMKKYNIQLK